MKGGAEAEKVRAAVMRAGAAPAELWEEETRVGVARVALAGAGADRLAGAGVVVSLEEAGCSPRTLALHRRLRRDCLRLCMPGSSPQCRSGSLAHGTAV